MLMSKKTKEGQEALSDSRSCDNKLVCDLGPNFVLEKKTYKNNIETIDKIKI